ncbi:MAG: carbamoyltransferase C-terminal domain-containing protein [Minicystis sp.]
MKILGINGAFQDSAACLVVDGVPVAAAEEERFTRVKHHKRVRPFNSYALPYHAIDYCLEAGGLRLPDLDRVAYSFDPFPSIRDNGEQSFRLPATEEESYGRPTFDAWKTVFLAGATESRRGLLEDAPWHLQARIGRVEPQRWSFHHVPHHRAHAASCFLASPFERAAVMTIDGSGGDVTTAYFLGEGTKLTPLGELQPPHSLGLLYELTTNYLGFLGSSDEDQVMAMAALGRPVHADIFRQLVSVGSRGDYRIRGPLVLGLRLGPERKRGEPIEQRHCDIACSLQTVLEETVLEIAAWLRRETGAENLCFAGGVAQNCVLSGKLRRSGIFRDVWVSPVAGDAGTALGAAMLLESEADPSIGRRYTMEHTYLGPGFADAEIEAFLRKARLPFRRMDDIAEEVADLLVAQQVVGWFQGRMEFGPSALGARSLLASATDPRTRERLDDIKGREQLRPVAPAVPIEHAAEWFDLAGPSPFMTFVERVRPERLSSCPAAAHVDGTARLQTVRREHAPPLHALLLAYGKKTGVPMLINTSFNVREEPIVCTPKDAVATFYTSSLEALVLGPYLLRKPAAAG